MKKGRAAQKKYPYLSCTPFYNEKDRARNIYTVINVFYLYKIRARIYVKSEYLQSGGCMSPIPIFSIQVIFAILGLAGLAFFLFNKSKQEYMQLENLLKTCFEKINNNSQYIRNSQFEALVLELRNFRCFIPNCYWRKIRYIQSLRKHIQKLNSEWKKLEIIKCRELFSDESGQCSLNEEQLEAVIADEDRNLVVAGAGSGKTSVIAHKVKYLLHQGIDPSDILLVSFTNASATDLQKRIKDKMGVEAKVSTLHSFASGINRKYSSEKKQVVDDKMLGEKIFEALGKTLKNRTSFLNFFEFYSKYFYDVKPLVYYKTMDELRKDLAKYGVSVSNVADRFGEYEFNPKFMTLKGDKVRSVDERYIADFFYLNGIRYEYEAQYLKAPYPYFPDFYLPDYKIYWEHFGLTKSGQPPLFFKFPKRYLNGIKEKRRLHAECKTRLIESVSYELNEGDSASYLRQICKQNGIKTKDLDSYDSRHFVSRKFQKLIQTFYCRLKLSRKNLNNITLSEKLRPAQACFVAFFKDFLENFQKTMFDAKKCDFTDLLINATMIYKKNEGDTFKYIIVDEFQDTSWVSIELIESVAAASSGCSIFAVGDDWQSIYGFNGSDVTIMKKFKEDNPYCQVVSLNSNYRSHKDIVDISKAFIEKNNEQWKKSVVSLSKRHSKATVEFILQNEMLNKIIQIGKEESIFLLGRYNNDKPGYLLKELHSQGFKNLEFKTIHRSKGLEAEHVFILFPDEEIFHFPSEMQDHFIMNLLKNSHENFPFAEERRLFYVAMTRAERSIYFVSPFIDSESSSSFWIEMGHILDKDLHLSV